MVGGRRVPLMGPQGIWKPAVCELPISVTTTLRGPYRDAFDRAAAVLHYSYRGTDPHHRDNVGLRKAMAERVPIIYFHPVVEGVYLPAWPVFVIKDDPATLTFTMQVDDIGAALVTSANDYPMADDNANVRRAYITRTVQQRAHQVAFRERVIRAYQQRCALCSLRHRELLDAAHITPDRDAEGDPVVSNGVALCKLHHAAFDRFFFAIRPDYKIEVKPSILNEHDGPMLVVGLQQIHDRTIILPRSRQDLPDPRRLQRRYEEFLAIR